MWETLACGLGSVKRGQRMTPPPSREDRHPWALDLGVGVRNTGDVWVARAKQGVVGKAPAGLERDLAALRKAERR